MGIVSVRADMANTYRVRDLRQYDRNVLHGGRPTDNRVLETVPHCWLCASMSGEQTREHVFARSLLAEFPADLTQFEPIRYTSLIDGLQVGSRRGPFPGTALVAGGVCASCNNGWMSDLESAARPYLLGEAARVSGPASAALARWFVKTAIVINVSQPYRLLWESHRRHRVRDGVPPNVRVWLHRAERPNVNWMQGHPLDTALYPSDMDHAAVARLFGTIHYCSIHVGTLVGTVVAYPWQFSACSFDAPGVPLWSPSGAHVVDLDGLPTIGEPLDAYPEIHVRPSAFWSGLPPDTGRTHRAGPSALQ